MSQDQLRFQILEKLRKRVMSKDNLDSDDVDSENSPKRQRKAQREIVNRRVVDDETQMIRYEHTEEERTCKVTECVSVKMEDYESDRGQGYVTGAGTVTSGPLDPGSSTDPKSLWTANSEEVQFNPALAPERESYASKAEFQEDLVCPLSDHIMRHVDILSKCYDKNFLAEVSLGGEDQGRKADPKLIVCNIIKPIVGGVTAAIDELKDSKLKGAATAFLVLSVFKQMLGGVTAVVCTLKESDSDDLNN